MQRDASRRTAALVQLDDRGRERGRWSHAQLEAQVSAAAAKLASVAAEGERALISASSDPATLIATLACLRVGVAAVPVSLTGSDPAIVERTGATLLIAPSAPDHAATLVRALVSSCEGLEIVTLDDAPPSPGVTRPSDPDALAILFDDEGGLTSTSVGLSHDQLDRQLAAFAEVAPLAAGEVFVSWLPLGRVLGRTLGLIASLHALDQGATLVTLPTAAALHDPPLWLRTLTRHRAAMTAAPGFMLDRCVRCDHPLEGVGLYSLHTLLSAPESLTSLAWARHAHRFSAHLSGCGLRPEALRPIYIPSICTAIVSASARRVPARHSFDRLALGAGELRSPVGERVELTSLGRPLADVELEIVDRRSRERCLPGQVGEIELRGPSLGTGDERVRTGELGALVDGELVTCGQLPGRRADPSLAEFTIG